MARDWLLSAEGCLKNAYIGGRVPIFRVLLAFEKWIWRDMCLDFEFFGVEYV